MGDDLRSYADMNAAELALVHGEISAFYVIPEDYLDQGELQLISSDINPMDTINRVLDAETRLLKDPAPTVAVSELADSSVNLVVRPWCNKEDYWGVRFETRVLIHEIQV